MGQENILRITEAVHKWLLVCAVVALVKELRCIPHNPIYFESAADLDGRMFGSHLLIHDLRYTDGMGGRASTVAKTASTSTTVSHVRLMVGTIEILSIPARREDKTSSDTTRARLEGETPGVLVVTWRKSFSITIASMADIWVRLSALAKSWITDNHSESLVGLVRSYQPHVGLFGSTHGLEGSDCLLLGIRIHVVDREAAVLLQTSIGLLRNPLEGAILRRLEV